MKRVLVTGSEGFTGRYVVAALIDSGYFVIPLALKSNTAINCDLTNKDAIKDCLLENKPDYIVHLAGISFVAHYDQNELYNINVFGTLNLLEAAFEVGLELDKLIIASSANVYGNYKGSDPIAESTSVNPINHYATSKLSMEFLVKQWFNVYPILITRPFNYTGVGQKDYFLIPKIVRHFKSKSKTIELGNVGISRDFSDVRDIANYYVALLNSKVHSEIVNLCSGKVESIADLLDSMAYIAGYEIEVVVNSDYIRKSDILKLEGDRSKLARLTNLSASFSMTDTLTEMYKHMDSK
ncbi:NAD-dependent epimerase/dehydratase family protein [Shewanella colwelliana]|uniref:NAD-dependent epimerase/dehydratase family protein n=1 Tax=Shewanella colwelliana TaxID=23 RepID=UPI0022AF615D|nr:NAD-dependent epimerase/dehydratase family protein [Shewanella colwelliana]MCZ4336715.1 GDP-mannose 4,6-dehydratase [Shewanella colwelliana]